MKRVLALVLCTALLLALTGCGGAYRYDPAGALEGGISIQIGNWELRELVRALYGKLAHDYPGLTVRLQYGPSWYIFSGYGWWPLGDEERPVPYDEEQMLPGYTPDIILGASSADGGINDLAVLVKEGLLLDLAPFLDADTTLTDDVFFMDVIDGLRWGAVTPGPALRRPTAARPGGRPGA